MTVVLVDDHPMLSMGLVQGLLSRGMNAVAMEPAEPSEFVERLSSAVSVPTLAVMDLAMPDVPCTPALVEAVVAQGVPVLMLSGSDDENALAACLLAGAMAVLSKNEPVEAILDMIEAALSGRQVRPTNRVMRLQRFDEYCRQTKQDRRVFDTLTSTEGQVLELLMQGRSALEIASERFVSLPTVRTQIKAVLAKLGVNSQLEAVALAHRRGFCFSTIKRQAS